jgi:hypothetical protein
MTSNKNAHPFSPHFVFPGTVEKFLALSTFFLAYSTHCMALSSATSAIAVSTVNATVDNLILTSGFKNRGGGTWGAAMGRHGGRARKYEQIR